MALQLNGKTAPVTEELMRVARLALHEDSVKVGYAARNTCYVIDATPE